MNWQDILSIIVPLGALIAWLHRDLKSQIAKVEVRIEKVETRMEKLEEKVNSLDSRIARIEGQLMHFEPRWEPKIKEKQND